jgi:hypothetical protein
VRDLSAACWLLFLLLLDVVVNTAVLDKGEEVAPRFAVVACLLRKWKLRVCPAFCCFSSFFYVVLG